uniref:Uncharacterized protein LOC100371355 n=1 Tax=Saccoglossus kowalevskii TaxID=10224 RepID=A0ABM0GLF4_SACKO|nr:PREDICTED: uncharacterized protein LOC100371355 [Saccoglossus kowalevskii]
MQSFLIILFVTSFQDWATSVTTDLEFSSFRVVRPYSTGSVSFLVDTEIDTHFSFKITNNGDNLGVDNGDPPFNITLYLTDADQTDHLYDLHTVSDHTTNISAELLQNGDVTLTTSIGFSYPKTQCGAASYICAGILPSLYVDNTASNDVKCLRMANGDIDSYAGATNCPDIAVESFTITSPSTVEYIQHSSVDIKLTVSLINYGSDIDTAPALKENFFFEIVLSSDDDLNKDNVTMVNFTMDQSQAVNANGGISQDASLSITDLSATLIAPESDERCQELIYFCLVVTPGTDAAFGEFETGNNAKCVKFDVSDDATNDPGVLTCKGKLMDRSKYKIALYPSLFLGFVVTQSFVVTQAVDADLYVFSVSFSLAPPSYVVDSSTVIATSAHIPPTLSIKIANQGPDDLGVASSGYHYNISFYLAESVDMLNPISLNSFDIGTEDSNRANAIPVGADSAITYDSWTASLTYPADKCATYSHFCVAIVKDGDATYIDSNSANDYKCLKFVSSGSDGVSAAGKTNCPPDPSLKTLVVTGPLELTYAASDSPHVVSADLEILNSGGTGDEDAFTITPANFSLEAYLCSADDGDMSLCMESGDVGASSDDALTFNPWDTVTMGNLSISVTMPSDGCYDDGYVCIQMVKDGAATYNDDSSNNYVCLEFGDILDGKAGIVACSTEEPMEAESGEFILSVLIATTTTCC